MGKVRRGSGKKKVAKLKLNSALALQMQEHRGQKTWWVRSSPQFLAVDTNVSKKRKVTVRRHRDVFPVVEVSVSEMVICSDCCQV